MTELVDSRSRQMLADLAVKKKSLKKKIEGEVARLVWVLRQIERMLDDADEVKKVENMEVLMDFAYKMEDFVENWAFRVEATYMRKSCIVWTLRRWFRLDDDGTTCIHDGFGQVEKAFGSQQNISPVDFHGWPSEEDKWSMANRSWPMHDPEENYVRIHLDKLMALFKENRLVSIYGATGMGKTSLARKVYHHADVRTRFQAFASVSFARHPDITSLARNIRDQLVGEEQNKGPGDSQIDGVKIEQVDKQKNVDQKGKARKVVRRRDEGVVTNCVDQKNKIKEEGREIGDGSVVGEETKERVEQKETVDGRVGGEETTERVEQKEIVDGRVVGEETKDGVEQKEMKEQVEEKEIVNRSVVGEEQNKGPGDSQIDGIKQSKREQVDHKGKSKGKTRKVVCKRDVGVVRNFVDRKKKIQKEEREIVDGRVVGEETKERVEQKEIVDGRGRVGGEETKERVEQREIVDGRVGGEETKGVEQMEIVNGRVGGEETKEGVEQKEIVDGRGRVGREETKERVEQREIVEGRVGGEETKEGVEQREIVNGRVGGEETKGGVEQREIVNGRVGGEETKERVEEGEIVEGSVVGEEQNKGPGDSRIDSAKQSEIDQVDKEKHVDEKGMRNASRRKHNSGAVMAMIRRIIGEETGIILGKSDHVKSKRISRKNQSDQENTSIVDKNEQAPKSVDAENTSIVDKNSDNQKQQLMKQLKEIQGRKKCFIVIDNVTETSQWAEISPALDINQTGILVTTVDTAISDAVIHKLEPLDQKDGWKLLKKHAFRTKLRVPEKGIAPILGNEMLSKCGGLPSKISRLGRILSEKPSREWHDVNKNIQDYLPTEDYQTQSNEAPFAIYDKLSNYQKQCFHLLAIFKGDEDVDSQDLKLLWIAEGMVSPHHPPMMKEAENYMELLADNLADNGRFKPLHLRKFVRELSLQYGVKHAFRLKVLDFSGGKQPAFLPSSVVRRLAIHFDKLSSSPEKDALDGIDLRSLFFLNSDREYAVLPVRISTFKEFELLRILHFVRCKFEDKKLPQGIEDLLNLRYLGVIYCDLDELPASLGSVRNLYILNVRAYRDAKITIPSSIYRMARLRHLCLPDNSDGCQSAIRINQGKSGNVKLDGLLDLESMDGFNADTHQVESLYKLQKLQHLVARASSNHGLESVIKFVREEGNRVRTKLYVESQCNFTSEEELEILEEVLMCRYLHSLTLSMVRLDYFPNCGNHASNHLTEIKLVGCKLTEDPMEALGNFSELQRLSLGYGAFVGKVMRTDDKGFPKLEYLELSCLSNLEEWRVARGAMKQLSAIAVHRCPKLIGSTTFASSLDKLQMELEKPSKDEMLTYKKSHTINVEFL